MRWFGDQGIFLKRGMSVSRSAYSPPKTRKLGEPRRESLREHSETLPDSTLTLAKPPANTIRAAELAPMASDATLPAHFESLLSAAYASDPFANEVLELLRTGARHYKAISLA